MSVKNKQTAVQPAEPQQTQQVEATAVVPYRPSWNAVNSLAEAIQVAELVAKSAAIPNVRNTGQALLQILAGQEMGFGPFASLVDVHIIEGKPSVGAHLKAAAIKRSGRYRYRTVVMSRDECTLEFSELVGGSWEVLGTVSMTMAEAVETGLAVKEVARNGEVVLKRNWRVSADDMLFARCISKGYRRYCFAGETEVVTRDGIRRIADLAGTDADVLIPTKGHNGGLGEIGCFVKAPVRSFGIQRLWEVKVRRSRTDLTIRVTAEHRWPLKRRFGTDPEGDWKTTAGLVPGDRLRDLRNAPIIRSGEPSPVAIMQGFVFGDGSRNEGKPTTLDIHGVKSEPMLPLFSICNPRQYTMADGKTCWRLGGLPKSWKDLPSIREHRPFLLGWLAGWFAADGSVGDRGHPTLCCAERTHLEFARSVCAVLGVRCGAVREKESDGFTSPGDPLRKICFLSLSARDLPDSFFLLPHHRERAQEGKRAREESPRDDGWVVLSVAETDREEEVFCATVDGVGAFALAGDIMTGNCPDLTGGVLAYDPDELEGGMDPSAIAALQAANAPKQPQQPEPAGEVVDAEFTVTPDPEQPPAREVNLMATTDQVNTINAQIETLGLTPKQVAAALKARGAESVEGLTHAKALEVIEALRAKCRAKIAADEAAKAKAGAAPEPAEAG